MAVPAEGRGEYELLGEPDFKASELESSAFYSPSLPNECTERKVRVKTKQAKGGWLNRTLFFSFFKPISYMKSCLTGVLVEVPSYPFPAIGHPVGVDSPMRSLSPSPSRSVFSCLPLRPGLEESFISI
mgnify:CR=1 FL=1